MYTIRQKARPKHQVLILKCYPRFQKTVVEVKPNSSELSYLLYYSSTRRSKLQKVGDFLEEKTLKDVKSGRIGNVQVTLQIITALIEKCSRDLPLFCGSVLKILDAVLQSSDIGLVEEAVSPFETFCKYSHATTLQADPEHVRQSDHVIRLFATYAANDFGRRSYSVPVALRFKAAGLKAIKAVVTAESFGADAGEKMRVVMPKILRTLQSEHHANYIAVLQDREEEKDQFEKESTLRRRQSVSIGRATDDTFGGADPSTAFGTTADVDERSREEVDVLALQSLRQICMSDNRSQLRLAATEILNFTLQWALTHYRSGSKVPMDHTIWATELFETVCRWTLVQDRFIILIVLMEGLIRSPIQEEKLTEQLLLIGLLRWLLRSNINFIGLSVMDVLIGLIHHLFLLLQLDGRGLGHPHYHRTSAATYTTLPRPTDPPSAPQTASRTSDVVKSPSTARLDVLEQMQICIGELATHVYYSDQIGDMLAALLLRLKPSALSNIPTPTAAVQNPGGAADAIADSVNLQETAHTDGFFSFDTARVFALRAAKNIILTANSKKSNGDKTAGRSRVDISAWNGTQWLLRDPDGRVRKAYVDAFLTWMNYEVDKKEFRLAEEQKAGTKNAPKTEGFNGNSLAKRAASNASQKHKASRKAHTSFLQLLHLAAYDNALQYADSESDILLLHVLLSSLIERFGVRSVRSGLPMIFRLQEDVPAILTWSGKVAVGTLTQSYFQAITETFRFENSAVGREIQNEISRRHAIGAWMGSVKMPPVQVDQIATPSNTTLSSSIAETSSQVQLYPFKSREHLVDCIADGYSQSLLSPPTSPAASPRRTFSVSGGPVTLSQLPSSTTDRQLPIKVKEQMMSEWSKETTIAALEKESGNPAASLSGGTGSGSGKRNNMAGNGLGSNTNDVHLHPKEQQILASRPASATYGHGNHGFGNYRRFLTRGTDTPLSSSSTPSVVRVSDLKRVLSGRDEARPSTSVARDGNDTASDSLVTASITGSETSLPLHTEPIRHDGGSPSTQAASLHTAYQVQPPSDAGVVDDDDDDIPPVPRLPMSLTSSLRPSPMVTPTPDESQATAGSGVGGLSAKKSLRNKTNGPQDGFSSWSRGSGGKVDLNQLLNGIGTTPRRPTTAGAGRPPY